MAKYKFTQNQFNEISELLTRRALESRDDQKRTRAKIRKLGFMISDYFNGFSEVDFKKLIDKGEIEIVKNNSSVQISHIKKSANKEFSSMSKNDVSKKALPPVIDESTEYLVLGTMPGEQSLINQEYYNNPRNQFWSIISIAFNHGDSFGNYTEKLNTLKNNGIGLWDVLDTCERKGSLDSNIKKHIINDFDNLFKNFPNIKTVIFNGQKSYMYFDALIRDRKDKTYLVLTSTSSANRKTINEKLIEWEIALTKSNH